MSTYNAFNVGNIVCLKGHLPTGEIIALFNNQAIIAFGCARVKVATDHLQKVQQHSKSLEQVHRLDQNENDLANFKPEIDLHGMSVQLALSTLDHWIDQAIRVGHMHLKVIHGKGEGILRKAVCTHCQKHSQIKHVNNQHPYAGGYGVTWLETI